MLTQILYIQLLKPYRLNWVKEMSDKRKIAAVKIKCRDSNFERD